MRIALGYGLMLGALVPAQLMARGHANYVKISCPSRVGSGVLVHLLDGGVTGWDSRAEQQTGTLGSSVCCSGTRQGHHLELR